MSAQTIIEFWRAHLIGITNPLIHFVPGDALDLGALQKTSGEQRFALFTTDAQSAHSAAHLMGALATAMGIPRYVQGNWDVFLDLARDLSWNKAKGYILILSNADSLLSLPNNGFSVLLEVLEATIREWRDSRGEYGERTGPIPFHVIFSGSSPL